MSFGTHENNKPYFNPYANRSPHRHTSSFQTRRNKIPPHRADEKIAPFLPLPHRRHRRLPFPADERIPRLRPEGGFALRVLTERLSYARIHFLATQPRPHPYARL